MLLRNSIVMRSLTAWTVPFTNLMKSMPQLSAEREREACPDNRDGAEATMLAIEEARQGALLAWKA
jgi:hypothetical protein